MVTWNTKIEKPLCFILFGFSLKELEDRIQEFKDLDVAWVSLNWQYLATRILDQIGKPLDYHVWFKGAQGTEHPTAHRFMMSDARGCSLLEFIHQCCENNVKELYLFGADGFTPQGERLHYYGITHEPNHGHDRHATDLEHFNSNYPHEKIKESGLQIYNTSQVSQYCVPKITIDQCLEKLRNRASSSSSEPLKA